MREPLPSCNCCCRARPAAPGTTTGKTGTPSAQTAGTAFNVTVNAVDANWNLVNTVTDTVRITSSDANARAAGQCGAGGGTQTFSVTFKTAGSATVTATDVTDGSKTANTSPSTTVNAGAVTKLQLLMPGETAAPGTSTGKTGTPTAQTAGTAFTVTVNAVDANWNLVSSTHTVAITSSDANAGLPANAALVGGTRTFSVTIKTAGSWTVTATDTDGKSAYTQHQSCNRRQCGCLCEAAIAGAGRDGRAGNHDRQDGHAERARHRQSLHRDGQRGGRQLEPGQYGHRHRGHHLQRRQRGVAGQCGLERRHQNLQRDSSTRRAAGR